MPTISLKDPQNLNENTENKGRNMGTRLLQETKSMSVIDRVYALEEKVSTLEAKMDSDTVRNQETTEAGEKRVSIKSGYYIISDRFRWITVKHIDEVISLAAQTNSDPNAFSALIRKLMEIRDFFDTDKLSDYTERLAGRCFSVFDNTE